MTLVPTSEQSNELLTSIGDFGDGVLAAALGAKWAEYNAVGGRLQYLYVKRDLIDLAMGEIRRRVDFQTPSDVSVQASQLLGNLLKIRGTVIAEIEKLEAAGSTAVISENSQVVAFVGEMLTTGSTSVRGLPGQRDANDVYYRGNPYYRRPRRLP